MTAARIERTLDILRNLIAFDTTSGTSNSDFLSYVDSIVTACGGSGKLVDYDPARGIFNYLATLGATSEHGLGTVLSAHTDTVPSDGQAWTSAPYELTVHDGRAVGRGTADMKGFIACALVALESVSRSGSDRPVSLLLTADEEIGCLGMRTITTSVDALDLADGFVVGEPTEMRVIGGHKSKANFRLTVRARPVHASRASAVPNAAMAVAECIVLVDRFNEIGRRGGGHRDNRFDPPTSWISVGSVHGGTAPNIVAGECIAELEVRTPPGVECASVIKHLEHQMRERIDEQLADRYPNAVLELELRQLTDTPGFDVTNQPSEFLQRVLAANEQREPEFVSFGTEAGLLQRRTRRPSVVWGPGSITAAHTVDEFIEIKQLELCYSRLERLMAS